jgi:hypothetical protein
VLHPDEARDLLDQRRRALEADLQRRRAIQRELAPVIPRLFMVEDEYELALREAELRWVTGFIEELASGAVADRGRWAAFVEGGYEVPEEIAELSERGRSER